MNEPLIHGADLAEAEVVVYGVHGRGQSPEFIRDLADRVGGLDRLRWIMPGAPDNTWYPESFMAPVEDNEPFLSTALDTVDTQLADLQAGSLPVVVLGFSQGACLLAEHLLRTRPTVDAIILHTGGYLGPQPRSFPARPRFASTETLIFTARADPWVPLHRSEDTAQAFRDAGARVDFHIYEDTEHHINEDATQRIRELLSQIAASRPGTPNL